jgi:hypothetical protein
VCALASAAALAVSTTGCAQILGFTQDYYDAMDSSSVVPPFDGPVDNGDANSQPEATPPSEAGDAGDAGHASDAEAGTFCQMQSPPPTFCDDFDEAQLGAAFGWTYTHENTGTLALDTNAPASPPACLMAQTDVVMTSTPTTPVDTAVYKDLTIPAGATTFGGTLDLDMRVDNVDTPGNYAVLTQFGLIDGTGGGKYYLQLVATSNGAQALGLAVNEEFFATNPMTGMPNNHPVSAAITPGAWTHVTLTMTAPLASGAGTAVLVVDDGQPANINITVEVQKFSAELGIGVLYSYTPSNGWQVAYDNVVFHSMSQ